MGSTFSSTDSYLSLLTSIPDLPLESLFFLTLGRIIPIAILVPFLGARNLPAPVRMMFSLALVALFLPQNLLAVQRPLPANGVWPFLFLKELGIGAILGFLASAPFFLVQMSGSLIDHSRGSSSLQVSDPTTQTQTGPIGILFNYFLLAIFFTLGGPFLFFDGLAKSYQLLPIDQMLNPVLFASSAPFWKQTAPLLQKIFTLSVQFAAPALIGILLTDLFLGIANRLAPQVQIVFLGISLKSWVGIALLTASWSLVIQVIGKESIAWFKALNHWIESLSVFS